MKHLVSKDTRLRLKYCSTEHKRALLLSLYRSELISPSLRLLLQTKLNTLVQSSRTRIHNRCILTGRGHSVLRPFRLSRIQFRLFALSGLIPGVKKSSW